MAFYSEKGLWFVVVTPRYLIALGFALRVSANENDLILSWSRASSNCDCFEPFFCLLRYSVCADYALSERLVHAKFLRLSVL